MRGKRLSRSLAEGAAGLIPACAGKTRSSTARARWSPAHPRVCGENIRRVRGVDILDGSSPRVRGKPAKISSLGFISGLIPACAGKTFERKFKGWVNGAHPRVCGENDLPSVSTFRDMGSSPRVRGKRHHQILIGDRIGLIPACAGKTVFFAREFNVCGAHPRVCGENGKLPRTFDL